jgi:CDGSH-type Zn-finger protein
MLDASLAGSCITESNVSDATSFSACGTSLRRFHCDGTHAMDSWLSDMPIV